MDKNLFPTCKECICKDCISAYVKIDNNEFCSRYCDEMCKGAKVKGIENDCSEYTKMEVFKFDVVFENVIKTEADYIINEFQKVLCEVIMDYDVCPQVDDIPCEICLDTAMMLLTNYMEGEMVDE